MTTPLHLLAYVLSPRYYSVEILAMPDRVAPYADEKLLMGAKKPLKDFQDDEMHKKVRTEIDLFPSGIKHSPFAVKDQYDMAATTWWYLYGQPFKNLQPLAIKVLSQTVQVASSSAAERNWSTYSSIHSVKRNQLGSKKSKDLVYIHTNLCLLSRKEEHYKDGAAKLWDVALECANLEATVENLTRLTSNYDVDDHIPTHVVSSTSGTALGSNNLELAAVGDEEDFFENLYDFES